MLCARGDPKDFPISCPVSFPGMVQWDGREHLASSGRRALERDQKGFSGDLAGYVKDPGQGEDLSHPQRVLKVLGLPFFTSPVVSGVAFTFLSFFVTVKHR